MNRQLKLLWQMAFSHYLEYSSNEEEMYALWILYPHVADEDTKKDFDELEQDIKRMGFDFTERFIPNHPEYHSDSDQ